MMAMKKQKLSLYNDIKNMYWFLDSSEFNNPYQVLEEFFFMGDLHEHREELWNLYKVAIFGSYKNLDQISQENLLFLYEQVLKLVEALHALYTSGEIKKNKKRLNKKSVYRNEIKSISICQNNRISAQRTTLGCENSL